MRGQLLKLLLDFSSAGQETEQGRRAKLSLSHQELGEWIGTICETVTRTPSESKNRNLGMIKAWTRHIHNRPALENLVTAWRLTGEPEAASVRAAFVHHRPGNKLGLFKRSANPRRAGDYSPREPRGTRSTRTPGTNCMSQYESGRSIVNIPSIALAPCVYNLRSRSS